MYVEYDYVQYVLFQLRRCYVHDGCCFFSCGDAMCTMAAATTFSEPFESGTDRRRLSYVHKNLAGTRHSDHVAMLNAFHSWEEARCEQ